MDDYIFLLLKISNLQSCLNWLHSSEEASSLIEIQFALHFSATDSSFHISSIWLESESTLKIKIKSIRLVKEASSISI